MTTQYEVREFRDRRFTGHMLVHLIEDNKLDDFTLYEFATEHVPNQNGMTHMLYSTVDVVKFRRKVE